MRTLKSKNVRKLAAPLLIGWVLLAAGCGGNQAPRANTSAVVPGVGIEAAATDYLTSTSAVSTGEEGQRKLKLPGQTGEAMPQAQNGSGIQWSETPPCPAGDCGTLVITQGETPQRIGIGASAQIAASAQPAPLPASLSLDGTFVIDTGQPSPDGKWVAYTSISYESGGPVFLQNQETGEWINLIDAANRRLGEKIALPLGYAWDVIGWFPDSQRLMVGPGDMSLVVIIELNSSTARLIPFNGGGRGGRMFVNLAPDGQSFLFTAENSAGQQTFNQYDLNTGEVTVLYEQAYEDGFLTNPRLAPDGKTLAFVTQQGPAGTSAADTLNLLAVAGGTPEALVEGSLWMAVPTWSPDGERLAFAMAESAMPALAAGQESAAPPQPRGNVWVVTTSGEAEQVTFVDGLARSPVWAKDGTTLAFVTHDGQVGLADADQPGQIWQAARPNAQTPELISAFFLP